MTEWWPWLPFVLHGLWLGIRDLRGGNRDGPWTLILGWCAAVAAVLVSVQTAYSRYLIPILPATSLAAAQSLSVLLPRVRWERAPVAVAGLVAAGAVFVAAWPGGLRSAEVPDVIEFAPLLRERGAFDPPWFLGRTVPSREQAAAGFYLDARIRAVGPPTLRDRLAREGRAVVLVRRGRGRWPAGIEAARVASGRDVDLVEVRPAPGNGVR